jgi:hypothetical protein
MNQRDHESWRSLTRRDSGRGGLSIFKHAIERWRRVERNAKLPKLIETWNATFSYLFFFSIELGVRNYNNVLWLSDNEIKL